MARGWTGPIAAVSLCSLLAVASAQDWEGREQVGATLWMQRAPEFRAIAEQTHRLATQRDSGACAGQRVTEQQGIAPEVLARMPTAVVLDLDETVLDNTVYQARLLHDHAIYDAKSWGSG
jgi:acid phosphatase